LSALGSFVALRANLTSNSLHALGAFDTSFALRAAFTLGTLNPLEPLRPHGAGCPNSASRTRRADGALNTLKSTRTLNSLGSA
jgi:hypothetical protein